MNDNANFFIAIALSIGILMGWHWFYEVPRQKAQQARTEAVQALGTDTAPVAASAPARLRPRAEALKAGQRLPFANDKIRGSINLRGARVDDLILSNFRETIEPGSPPITLLSPTGSEPPHSAYYAEFGWLGAQGGPRLPDADSVWQTSSGRLGPGKPVTLRWDNGAGLSFARSISLDDNYVFTVTEKVRNAMGEPVTLSPFALISRHGTPRTLGFYTLHEGLLGVLGGTLHEETYKKLHEVPLFKEESTGGWLGITDIYWLAALMAGPEDKITGRFLYAEGGTGRYQTDMRKASVTVPAGGAAESTFHFFAGAKEVAVLDAYMETLRAPMFDRAIDFGWFYFITKPFFQILDFLYRFLGNYGLAIIVFTIALRAVFYPMSETSYRTMERMKALQPEMQKLKESHGNDPAKMNEAVTALYKKEKLNPLAGCLPMLIQIPVFFALYKVLLVSIEMRHAPFYGWIRDLSAPDPSNLFNLFGLLPFTTPAWLHLGALPLLMGVTMYIQQKLSPPPGDKTTQQIFNLMPVMFTFLLANMSAGLVLYWTFSNILAIAQQTLIKHRIRPAAAGK